MSVNTATVSYINKQGGVVFQTHNAEACTLCHWANPWDVQMIVIHQSGVTNELADYLFRKCPDPSEYSLCKVIQKLYKLWGTPQPLTWIMNHSLNHHLPVWFCSTTHPMVVAQNTLVQTWPGCSSMPFPPFPSSRGPSSLDPRSWRIRWRRQCSSHQVSQGDLCIICFSRLHVRTPFYSPTGISRDIWYRTVRVPKE